MSAAGPPNQEVIGHDEQDSDTSNTTDNATDDRADGNRVGDHGVYHGRGGRRRRACSFNSGLTRTWQRRDKEIIDVIWVGTVGPRNRDVDGVGSLPQRIRCVEVNDRFFVFIELGLLGAPYNATPGKWLTEERPIRVIHQEHHQSRNLQLANF